MADAMIKAKNALTPAEVTTLRQQRAAGVRIKDLMHQYGPPAASGG
jgi:hypothetical protein